MEFEDGYVEYGTLNLKTFDELDNQIDLSDWDDGYLAFSNCELRLDEKIKTHNLLSLSQGNVKSLNLLNAEGYLMEIDLWRQRDGIVEEISLEREAHGWWYQGWKLDTKNTAEPNCYYRSHNGMVRQGKTPIFKDGDISSIEIIAPDKRLHFFISTGRNDI